MTRVPCNNKTGKNTGPGGNNVTENVTETEEKHGIKEKNPELCNYQPSGRTGQKWMKPRHFLANSDLLLFINSLLSRMKGNIK